MERNPLRSARWFGANDLAGFIHRASLHAEGISRAALEGRPVIGICNAWSELVNCNLHFRGLAEAAKRGVLQAGGLPLEFPTISLGENLMKPSAMLFRNLMAMDVEECIRSYPLDAVVLLGGCDKTVPAQLMGAVSAGVPAIMVTGGPSQAAYFRGRELGAGTDLWHYADELRAGRMSQEAFAELEAAATPSFGHCNELGTASTMAALVEALGMCLPGTSTIPAVDAARMRAAEQTGTRAVALAREGLAPAQIITAESLDNAITLLMALGGGTNAVVHLLALAGRLGVPLTLDRFDELSRRTPVIGNLRPSGEHLFEHLHRAGGVQAVLRQLAPLLHGGAATVTGETLEQGYANAETLDRAVIATLAEPLAAQGGLAILRGSLAPSGAVIKQSAASAALLAPSRPGARVRGRLRRAGAHRRPGARRLRPTPCSCCATRAPRRPRHARVGAGADPEEAARPGRDRHGARLGRAHERHGLRHRRAARRAGVGRRRPARGGARRRSRSCSTSRRGASTSRSRPRRSSAASPSKAPSPRPRTRAATVRSTSSTCCRPTRAATSTSCAPSRAPSRERAARPAQRLGGRLVSSSITLPRGPSACASAANASP